MADKDLTSVLGTGWDHDRDLGSADTDRDAEYVDYQPSEEEMENSRVLDDKYKARELSLVRGITSDKIAKKWNITLNQWIGHHMPNDKDYKYFSRETLKYVPVSVFINFIKEHVVITDELLVSVLSDGVYMPDYATYLTQIRKLIDDLGHPGIKLLNDVLTDIPRAVEMDEYGGISGVERSRLYRGTLAGAKKLQDTYNSPIPGAAAIVNRVKRNNRAARTATKRVMQYADRRHKSLTKMAVFLQKHWLVEYVKNFIKTDYEHVLSASLVELIAAVIGKDGKTDVYGLVESIDLARDAVEPSTLGGIIDRLMSYENIEIQPGSEFKDEFNAYVSVEKLRDAVGEISGMGSYLNHIASQAADSTIGNAAATELLQPLVKHFKYLLDRGFRDLTSDLFYKLVNNMRDSGNITDDFIKSWADGLLAEIDDRELTANIANAPIGISFDGDRQLDGRDDNTPVNVVDGTQPPDEPESARIPDEEDSSVIRQKKAVSQPNSAEEGRKLLRFFSSPAKRLFSPGTRQTHGGKTYEWRGRQWVDVETKLSAGREVGQAFLDNALRAKFRIIQQSLSVTGENDVFALIKHLEKLNISGGVHNTLRTIFNNRISELRSQFGECAMPMNRIYATLMALVETRQYGRRKKS